MTTTTQINITAKDSTAAAFGSATGNLSALSSSAVRAAASIAGVTLSFAGLASSIKSSIDAADATFKLSQKVGVAVEQLAGLELGFKQSGLSADQLQTSLSKLAKNVSSGSSAFDAMGIATQGADGNLKSTRQILSEVADKFAGYEDGIGKTALAVSLFGKAGADIIPFLNGGSEAMAEFDAIAEKLGLTISETTGKRAEEFNDTVSLIGQSFTGLSKKVSGEMLPTLNGLAKQFFKTAENGKNVANIAGFLSTALKGLVATGYGVAGAFQSVGQALGGTAAMMGAIISGEFSQASVIFKQMKADFSGNITSTIESVTKAMEANGASVIEVARADANLSKEQAPLIKNFDAATKSIEKQSKALNWQVGNLKELQKIYSKVQSVTRGVETDQEKYNRTLDELNELKPWLGAETYARALQKAQDELRGTVKETRVTTNELDQLWTQAGRNIQSSLANSIFNFFDDGLNGMVKNVGIAVGRIASEFAALKLAQGLGIGAIFGGASGAAMAGGGGGGGSVLSGAVSLGSNALSFLGGGGKLLGSAASALGFGAFGAGASGAATAGVFGAGGASYLGGAGTAIGAGAEFGTAATLGASMAGAMAIAGPLIAVDIAGRLLAGDKKLGGAEMIPVIGGVLAALFGHGPYKYRQQSLQGTVSSGGFDGDIANVYRSKGGLISKNKHRTVMQELSADQQGAFDSAIAQFYTSAHAFAENLGLSADLVDNYTKEIQIKSKKGGKITEEAITEMLAGIGNGLAENILPIVSTLKNAGEDAFATLSRLNTEFNVLVNVAGILGNSVKDSREIIQGVTFESREAFLQMAGGIESLSQQTARFAQNFLTDAENLAPIQESLAKALGELNLSSEMTKDEFKTLVQSFGEVGGASAETFTALLRIQDEFLIVANAAEQAAAAAELESKAKQDAIKAEQIRYATADSNERKRNDAASASRDQSKMRAYLEKLKDGYQAQLVQGVDKIDGALKSITDSVSKLASLTGLISSAADGIKPQALKSAQDILAAAAVRAKRGDFVNDSDIAGSLSTVQSIDGNGFASSLDLARQQAIALESMSQIAVSATGESNALSNKIPGLEREKSDLITKMSEFIGRVDMLIADIGRAVGLGDNVPAFIGFGEGFAKERSKSDRTLFGGGSAPKGYNFGQRPRKESAEDVLNKILAAMESNASATAAMANKIKRWDGDGMPDVRVL